MGEKEVRRFRVMNVIRALAEPNNRSAQEGAAFEFEACHAAAKKFDRAPQGLFLPADVYCDERGVTPNPEQMQRVLQRDIVAGVGGTGQYLVGTQTMSMIGLLENTLYMKEMGAQSFTGLVGDVEWPTATAGSTSYWVGEADNLTESTPTFGNVTGTPKTCGGFVDLTRKIVQQSSIDIENWVRNELILRQAIAIDLAAIHGAGTSNEPMGIVATTGIGSVAGGTDGLAPTYAHMCQLEREVGVDNAIRGNLAFLTSHKGRYKMRQIPEHTTGTMAKWLYTATGPNRGEILGYPCYITNQVSDTLEKGSSGAVCTAVIFGNWNDLYLMFWGGMDINVDTATLSKSGGLRVVGLQSCDVAVAHPQSFAAMLDALMA